MTSVNSPVIEYYPVDFKSDLNGKQQEWEAVVLIPFIQEVKQLGTFIVFIQGKTVENIPCI